MDFTGDSLALAPLTVDIRGNNSAFKSAMAETKALGSKTSRGIENDFKNSSGGIGKAFASIGGAVQTAGKKVSSFGSSIQNVGKDAQKVGSNLTSHITKPLLGIGAALGGLTLGLGMKRLVGIDDAKAKLEALGNSTEEVDEIMQNADKAIEGTSMRLDETATVAASASAAGVDAGEDLTRYLGLTADAASVAGTSMSDMGNVLNKATTQGKAQNDVLQQLSEQGLPVYEWLGEEADKAGDEIFQMASDGEVSTEMLLDAIENNIGGAARIMGEKSFTSALQNMSTYLGHVGAAFLDGKGEGEGFFSAIKSLMVDFSEYLQSITPKAEELGEKFGQSFTNMIDKLKQAKSWYDNLSDGQQDLIKKVATFGTAALAFLGPVITIAGKLLVPFGGLIKVIGSAITWVGSLATSFGALLGPIGMAIGVVTAIGLAFGAAKSDGDLLKSAFDGLKNGAKGIVEWFGQLVDVTREWAEGLNFEPITNSFKGLSDSLKPFTQNIFDGLRWGYENVLLPLGGFVIEDALPNFFDALGGAIDFVNGVVEGLKPTWDFLWNKVLVPLGDWAAGAAVKTLEGVGNALSGIGNFIAEHQEGFGTFVVTFGTFAATLKIISAVSTAVTVLNGVVGAITAMGGLTGVLSAVGTGIMGIITMLGGPWALAIGGAIAIGVLLWKNWDTIKQYADPIIGAVKGIASVLFGPLVGAINVAVGVGKWLYGNWDTIKEKAGELGGKISETWKNIKQWTSEKWESVKKTTSEKWDDVKDKVGGAVKSAKNNVQGKWATIRSKTFKVWGQVKSSTDEKWNKVKDKIGGAVKSAKDDVQDKWAIIRSKTKGVWGEVKKKTDDKWSAIKDKVGGAAKTGQEKVAEHWSDLRKNTKGTFDDVVDWSKKLPGRIGKGVKKGKGAVAGAFKTIFGKAKDAVKGPVNGIIGGANWVLDKFGVSKKNQIDTWQPKTSYATGTLLPGGHPGGDAIVNDGRGAETIIEPHKDPYIQKGKNVKKRNMKPGTHVINAEDTAAMNGLKRPTFRYALGTVWDGIKSFGSSAWKGVKSLASAATEKIGDVFDFISDPGKLVDKVIGHFTDTEGLQAGFTRKSGKGLISKTKSAFVDWIQDKFDEFGSMGEFDGEMGKSGKWKVYDYLWDVAQKVIKKFPQMSVTSGYRPNSSTHHGKHQAIDVAYPASMNGSSKYKDPANYAFNNFKDQIGYVIALNKIKDRTGDGGQGVTNSWKKWPSGGHMDHLHLSGKYGPSDVGKGGDGFAGGSGVGRWKNTAIKALKMTGQYSAGNLKLLMNQMKSESNGNPKAINNWDANAKRGTPSKGLMQVIDPTFQSNKYPGHGNIWNPLDNMLAAIRYTLRNYSGSLAKGWRSVGYANGGFVTSKTYFAGERGPEAILPLDDKERSEEIIAQSLKYMNMKMPEPAPFDGYNASLNKTKKTIHADGSQHSAGNSQSGDRLDAAIDLLTQLLEKEKVVELNIDGNTVSRATWKYDERNMEIENKKRSRLNGGETNWIKMALQ